MVVLQTIIILLFLLITAITTLIDLRSYWLSTSCYHDYEFLSENDQVSDFEWCLTDNAETQERGRFFLIILNLATIEVTISLIIITITLNLGNTIVLRL